MLDYLREYGFGSRNRKEGDPEMVSIDILTEKGYVHDEEFRDLEMPTERTLTSMFSEEFFDVALAGLPDAKQEVFRLYYMEGLTLREIGKRVGYSEAWVHKSMKKSLEHLRKVWSEEQLREMM
jgi:RNA polymerase sigma factor (sigma-70 family)